MPEMNESSNEIWELAEFCAREAMLLRSFVEYLRAWPDPAEKKMERLQHWKREIGLLLGNPSLSTSASRIFHKLRACESVISSIRGLIQTNGEAISSTPSKDPTAQVVQL